MLIRRIDGVRSRCKYTTTIGRLTEKRGRVAHGLLAGFISVVVETAVDRNTETGEHFSVFFLEFSFEVFSGVGGRKDISVIDVDVGFLANHGDDFFFSCLGFLILSSGSCRCR